MNRRIITLLGGLGLSIGSIVGLYYMLVFFYFENPENIVLSFEGFLATLFLIFMLVVYTIYILTRLIQLTIILYQKWEYTVPNRYILFKKRTQLH